MKDGEKKGAGLLVGLLEGEDEGPKSKPMGKPKEDGEGDADMKAARLEALSALKAAMDGEDLEAADEALQDYMAACEGY